MDDSEDGMATSAEFAEALARLKREGSLLLTTGAEAATLDAACARLTGDAVSRPRELLRVLTHDRPDGPTAGASPEDARTVRYRTETRSATAASTSVGRPARTVTGGLDDLFEATAAEIDAVADARAGLEPAELRVCVDGLGDLLAAHDERDVFTFLHGLGHRVREADAMCHVHLPAAMDDEAVALVEPLFDAVIEVRGRAGAGTEQRWHLRDPDLTTDWLSL